MALAQLVAIVGKRREPEAELAGRPEQPPRLQLGDRVSPRRVKADAASFAIVAALFGLAAALDWRWLLGAVVRLANWPSTIFVIMPTKRRLIDTPPEAASPETRRMIARWGTLMPGEALLVSWRT
jgi:hypothetical protein